MQLTIKPAKGNSFLPGGILIKGSSVEEWLREIQFMGLSLSAISVYPVPGVQANTVWGCFIEHNFAEHRIDLGRNSACQVLFNLLFIPVNTDLFPQVIESEMQKLLHGKKHVYHPEFGFVEIPDPIAWQEHIVFGEKKEAAVKQPVLPEFIPSNVKSYQVNPVKPEDVLKDLEEKAFPKRERMDHKPLNTLEKGKLAFYKTLFTRKKDKETGKSEVEKKPLFHQLEKLRGLFGKKPDDFGKEMEENFEDLEKRNQEQMERLLEMLRENPEEALKYAIPIDPNGTNRGSLDGAFDLSQRWDDFSFWGQGAGGAGGGSVASDRFNDLAAQYNKIAQDLIAKKDYKKAAFVYMKLLKNAHGAGNALETGEHYQEAASVYLKYANNKNKAAECFEKGSMTLDAIGLYKELNQDEKVGDLYISINKQPEAFFHYEKTAESYKSQDQYVKASLVYRNKMLNPASGQSTLMAGWREDKDAFNCLNNYFNNIEDEKKAGEEIRQVYQYEVKDTNRAKFLNVIKYEHDKRSSLSDSLKEMAYEIVVQEIPKNPDIVSELRDFNKKDKQLVNDTLRFRTGRNKKLK